MCVCVCVCVCVCGGGGGGDSVWLGSPNPNPIPFIRPGLSHSYHFQAWSLEKLQNHTLWHQTYTYLYSLLRAWLYLAGGGGAEGAAAPTMKTPIFFLSPKSQGNRLID